MNHQSPGLAAGYKSLRVDSSASPSAPLPQIPDHELLRRVGEGAYGEVWLAKNVMGTYRAVKVVYRRNFSDDHPYEREFAGIKRFEPISRAHASQVDILHVGRNDQAGYFYYIMELADDAGENPKPEGRNPKEVEMPKSEAEPLPRPATDSGFGIPSG